MFYLKKVTIRKSKLRNVEFNVEETLKAQP